MAKEAINECVEKIIAKDFTKAKAIIAEHLKNSSNNKIIGSVFALEGIIAKYSPKNVDMNDSIEDFKMMKKGQLKMSPEYKGNPKAKFDISSELFKFNSLKAFNK